MKVDNPNLKTLPDDPGVYFFKGKKNEIFYIGRATSLKDRVKSYFSVDLFETRGPLVVKMVESAETVEFEKTNSVLEAIILEANLIRKYHPPYNTIGKDDKSYNYLVITREDFPRVLTIRGKDLDTIFAPEAVAHVFGPFPSGLLFREAIRLVRKIFPFRDTCVPESGKPCFNAQIGLCPGICSGAVSKKEYAQTIKHIRLLFEGKKGRLITLLEREMQAHAKKQEFEKAEILKRQIFALNHIQDVTLIRREVRDLGRSHGVFRMEAYDIAHTSGTYTTGVMAVVEDREVKKSDYRKFRIRSEAGGSDTHALREVLNRRFSHEEWRLPNLIVMDGGKIQRNLALEVLSDFGYQIPVVSVVKDQKHRPREIIGISVHLRERERDIVLANAEAHRFAVKYHRHLREKLP